MAIATDLQRKVCANAYTGAAPYGTLFTATPAASGAATSEVTGGSFARVNMAWGTAATSGSTAVSTSAATAFAIPASTTVTYWGCCVSATLTTADVRDTAAVTSQTFSSAGSYTVTATYTQT